MVNTNTEWPKWIIFDGFLTEMWNQEDYDSHIESGWRDATQEEIDTHLLAKKINYFKHNAMPYISALIIECRKRLDTKPITAVDISSIINENNGKIDLDEMNRIIDEHNEELVEYAIAATTLIDIFNAVHTGTAESMKLLANTDHEECIESCRLMWNKVALKNLPNLVAHGFTEELFDDLHEYSASPAFHI